MSAAPANLLRVGQRPCFWSPDYAYLSFLRPQPGRTMQISAAMQFNVEDASPAANQTLAASTTIFLNFNPNQIAAGTWTAPGSNQVIVFESLRAGIRARDASGKIQLATALLGLGDNATAVPINSSNSLPFTFPLLSGIAVYWCALEPIPLLLPNRPGSSPNGPIMTITLINTDTASHLYTRIMTGTYRLIDGVSMTSGPAVPGAGIGGEYA